jgi:hypothetical protein
VSLSYETTPGTWIGFKSCESFFFDGITYTSYKLKGTARFPTELPYTVSAVYAPGWASIEDVINITTYEDECCTLAVAHPEASSTITLGGSGSTFIFGSISCGFNARCGTTGTITWTGGIVGTINNAIVVSLPPRAICTALNIPINIGVSVSVLGKTVSITIAGAVTKPTNSSTISTYATITRGNGSGSITWMEEGAGTGDTQSSDNQYDDYSANTFIRATVSGDINQTHSAFNGATYIDGNVAVSIVLHITPD